MPSPELMWFRSSNAELGNLCKTSLAFLIGVMLKCMRHSRMTLFPTADLLTNTGFDEETNRI